MNLINNNPYRTLGLLVGATAREKERQVKRLKQFIEAEQDPDDDFSFPVLENLHRTIESITEAASKINLDSDKINAALFWFYKGNEITDEPAFEALKEGNVNAALQIWDKLIIDTKEDGGRVWKSVAAKNCSAFHNYFVAVLLTNEKSNIQTAVVANLMFLESDFAMNFKALATDETFKSSKKELQLLFLNQLVSALEETGKMSSGALLQLLNKQQFSAKEEFLQSSVGKTVEEIEKRIEEAKAKRKSNKGNAVKAGQELFESTTKAIAQLKQTLGLGNQKYISVADKVANEILQCSIDYFNYYQENESDIDYFEPAWKLAKSTEAIAVGKLTTDRIVDCLNTLEEMKDKEMSEAIQVLQSIKEAYETNKAKMTADVLAMPLGYNQSINWSKVNEMIENSLDWNKVVELVKKTISPGNVEKIRNIENTTAINEFRSLMDFLLSKLSFSQVNQIKYICYWKTENTVSNVEFTVKSLPEWAKWCLGIAIFLLVVGLIWGEDGLSVVLGIAAFFGIMFLIGWLRTL